MLKGLFEQIIASIKKLNTKRAFEVVPSRPMRDARRDATGRAGNLKAGDAWRKLHYITPRSFITKLVLFYLTLLIGLL